MYRPDQLAAVSILALSVPVFALAWTAPTGSPPGNNVSAPVNVGATDQVKNAGLGVNALAVFGNAILSGASRYLNFGSGAASAGYGIRDNAGTLEFKNNGGSWQSIQNMVYNLTGGTNSWTASGTNIYNSNSGNVGVGTVSPAQKLDVNGSIQIANGQNLIFNSASDSGVQLGFGTNIYRMGSDGHLKLMSQNGNIELNANVGVGTASPTGKLEISGDGTNRVAPTYAGDLILNRYTNTLNSAGGLEFKVRGDSSGSGWRIFAPDQTAGSASTDLVFQSRQLSGSWTERVRILADGSVGIGTASPGQKLDVAGGYVRSDTGFCIGASCITAWTSGLSGSGTAGYLMRWTGGTSAGNSIVYDNGASVGIGTASPNTGLEIGNGGDGWQNGLTIRSSYPTIYLRDVDGRGAMIHNNSSMLYILSSCATDGNSAASNNWCPQANGQWPLTINLNTNDATFGGNLAAVGAGSFADAYVNNWFRVNNGGGIYWQTYGGGWYMQDATWIRTYNNTGIWAGTGNIGTNGTLTVGYGGVPGTGTAGGATFAGNVGIGTQSPGAKLEVYSTASGDDQLVVRTNQPETGISLRNDTTATTWQVGLEGSPNQIPLGSFFIQNENTGNTAFTIAPNGNVGIGSELDVAGTVKITDGTQGAGKVLTSDASGAASWQTPSATVPSGTMCGSRFVYPNGLNYAAPAYDYITYNGTSQIAAMPNVPCQGSILTVTSLSRYTYAPETIVNGVNGCPSGYTGSWRDAGYQDFTAEIFCYKN